MDEKYKITLERWGAKQILKELVNIPERGYPDCDIRVSDFLNKYGPLRPEPPVEVANLARAASVALPKPPDDVIEAAAVFRSAWTVSGDSEALERFIESLFALPIEGPFGRPTVRLDFATGRWEPVPRCLIESLVVELIRSRRMLHRCERPECRRFFVKDFSRDRYCSSMPCSEMMRSRGQAEWRKNHSEELNARRRKPSKKGRKRP